jgi:endonuclease VIII
MPEGDTITRTARTLHTALAGKRVTRLDVRRDTGAKPVPGTNVVSVEARGKQLLVHFGDGRSLHTHLQMHGSWHLYRVGEPWRRSHAQARVVLEVEDGTVAVCFAAPVVELLDERRPRRAAAGLDSLGPDLCRTDADLDDVLRRLARVDPAVEIAPALLDQKVAAGIGNVYKSEVCFACGLDPAAPVGALDGVTRPRCTSGRWRCCVPTSAGSRRVTVAGGLAVYGRAGQACRRCGTRIRRRQLGAPARSTYWCPTCQTATASANTTPR